VVHGRKNGEKDKSRGPFARVVRYALIAAPIVLVLAVSMLAGMEYYTGQSRFCGETCHIMAPYYDSWKQDAHSKNDVACVDCHYAPGERHAVKAKLRGLSQLVSCFSGRVGASRMRPRVQDASCLKSGCHDTSQFMDSVLLIRDVEFVHAKHLIVDEERVKANEAELAETELRLRAALGDDVFQQVQDMAILADEPRKHRRSISRLVNLYSSDPRVQETAGQYALLLHQQIRLRQLDNLHCTTCHAHNDNKQHFDVRRETCNLCHFVGQPFNTGTARCLNCHRPPAIAVPVHGRALKVSEHTTTATGGMMDHSVIIAKNVNCVSCHADLVAGSGRVDRQRCSGCHDLPKYFVQFDQNLNTETVESLHRVHTFDMHTRCSDCHELIQHRLPTTDLRIARGGFLAPVLDNCAHCHPNHHRGQVEMLAGRAPNPLPPGMPNAMFGSRVNCLGCHTRPGTDPTGTRLMEATKQACVICHAEDYEQLFDQWVNRLDAQAKDVQLLENRALQLLNTLSLGDFLRDQAGQAIARGQAALRFVQISKGIHNRNYALELLDYASDQFTQAIELITKQSQPTAKTGEQTRAGD